MELTFEDFDIEPYDDCKTDWLEVKDGGTVGAPLIGAYLKITRVLTSC